MLLIFLLLSPALACIPTQSPDEDDLMTTTTTAAPFYMCTTGWTLNPATNLCYFVNTNPLLFDDAETFCVAAGGHLASIGDLDEQNFVYGVMFDATSTVDNIMIGASKADLDTTFTWTDATPFVYMNWPGAPPVLPNGDFSFISVSVRHPTNPGTWFEQELFNNPLKSICEAPAFLVTG